MSRAAQPVLPYHFERTHRPTGSVQALPFNNVQLRNFTAQTWEAMKPLDRGVWALRLVELWSLCSDWAYELKPGALPEAPTGVAVTNYERWFCH